MSILEVCVGIDSALLYIRQLLYTNTANRCTNFLAYSLFTHCPFLELRPLLNGTTTTAPKFYTLQLRYASIIELSCYLYSDDGVRARLSLVNSRSVQNFFVPIRRLGLIPRTFWPLVAFKYLGLRNCVSINIISLQQRKCFIAQSLKIVVLHAPQNSSHC